MVADQQHGERRGRHPVPQVVVLALWMGLGVALLLRGGREVVLAQETRNWLRTQGEVDSSAVVVTVGKGGNEEFKAAISYRYRVGDGWREGDVVGSGYRANKARSQAQALVDEYPPGAKTMVYYDPDRPDRAVLLATEGRADPVEILIGAGTLGIGGAIGRSMWRRRRGGKGEASPGVDPRGDEARSGVDPRGGTDERG